MHASLGTLQGSTNESPAVGATAGSPSLSLVHITHRFGRRVVVDDVSFSVAEREVVCLLGPSGCGKTTLLRIAAGLELVQAGRLSMAGRVVAEPGSNMPPEQRKIGFVFQDYALFPHLSVGDNVAFGLRGLPRAERSRRVAAMLERVGMAGHARAFPHMLSGGEQQRIALARAMAPEPRVVLLDEPFSSLDVHLREEVREQTIALLRGLGTAALIVTHDAEEAMFMADRMLIMRAGRIVQEGTPDRIYRRPASAFVTKFLGAANSVHGVVRDGLVESPLGVFAADAFADGIRVDVLVRPEAIALGEGTLVATVAARHVLGHESVLTLRLPEGAGEVRVRVTGDRTPAVGSQVSIRIRSDDVLVFPCVDASAGAC
jgi:iron(III) transport system ATP-binding protein